MTDSETHRIWAKQVNSLEEKMRRASRVMSERAESCRRMGQTCAANGYAGEAFVQTCRASAYDAAAKTILEILEEK